MDTGYVDSVKTVVGPFFQEVGSRFTNEYFAPYKGELGKMFY